MATVISVTDLSKSFSGSRALNGINFAVEVSELIALIGPSGCGKSTLLRCLNGLELLDEGRVQIGDIALERHHGTQPRDFPQRLRALREEVGMVFQSFNLFPHLTVLENAIKAPLVVRKMSRAQAEEKARALLDKVGLGNRVDYYPAQLSGGQQQRAAIARALTMSPKVMLYDEPTSALDPGLVGEVLAIMRQLDEEGMTQIVVTHEMRFARQVADRIFFLQQGELIEAAPPEELFTAPRDERTRQFLKDFL
jgi:ABC-type polar amino acid transport system ATPase subunit